MKIALKSVKKVKYSVFSVRVDGSPEQSDTFDGDYVASRSRVFVCSKDEADLKLSKIIPRIFYCNLIPADETPMIC